MLHVDDVDYLFDKLSKEDASNPRAPASPLNSPLPLPITSGAAGSAAPGRAVPTVGVAQLKFALRAFGLPVRHADVLGLLRRHGAALGLTTGQQEQEEDTTASSSARLPRAAFRQAVAAALREAGQADTGPDADLARAFALLDRGGKGAVTRADLQAAAEEALGGRGGGGVRALGGDRALDDMLALFSGGAGGGAVNLAQFVGGMRAVAAGRRPAVAMDRREG